MGLRVLQAQKNRAIVRTKTRKFHMTQHTATPLGFEATEARFQAFLAQLNDPELMDHSAIEETAHRWHCEVIRQAIEDKHHRLATLARQQVQRRHRLQHSLLESRYGTVTLTHLAILKPGGVSLRPLDALANFPLQKYSHPLQKLVCQEVGQRSFNEALESIERNWPAHLPKRQALEMAIQGAQDFEAFYQLETLPAQGEILAGSLDGSGVPMRPEGLREETRKKALKGKKNQQDKRTHKRMATVAAVYTTQRHPRTAQQIVQRQQEKPPGPGDKRVWASLERSAEQVTRELYTEMLKRDPTQSLDWVMLVDGEIHQLERVESIAQEMGVTVTVVLDLMHVLGYLWQAAHGFYDAKSPQAQEWVDEQLLALLEGKAVDLAQAMSQKWRKLALPEAECQGIEACARYLLNNQAYLRYDLYLEKGFPIATGVIEGACRYLIKDRMDRTGSRWGLAGAEAILKLRALIKAGDFEAYWDFHLEQERRRNYPAIPPESSMDSCL